MSQEHIYSTSRVGLSLLLIMCTAHLTSPSPKTQTTTTTTPAPTTLKPVDCQYKGQNMSYDEEIKSVIPCVMIVCNRTTHNVTIQECPCNNTRMLPGFSPYPTCCNCESSSLVI
uniref:8.9 kDa family member n=1 Tax=Rhipicephalus pulchellus TaxID=72859 RepID=L7MAB4_RHIPC